MELIACVTADATEAGVGVGAGDGVGVGVGVGAGACVWGVAVVASIVRAVALPAAWTKR